MVIQDLVQGEQSFTSCILLLNKSFSFFEDLRLVLMNFFLYNNIA